METRTPITGRNRPLVSELENQPEEHIYRKNINNTSPDLCAWDDENSKKGRTAISWVPSSCA